MSRKQGFTLVELLVVIAIIAILAGIVVPKVGDYIGRARMARALSEIKGADLAITKMLSDADKKSIASLFDPNDWEDTVGAIPAGNMEAACHVYSDICYELLRLGKTGDFTFTSYPPNSADVPVNLRFREGVQQKLASSYMDLGTDPWGSGKYYFYVGPVVVLPSEAFPFRSYRININPLDGSVVEDQTTLYQYTEQMKDFEDSKMRGNPKADNGFGFPAPNDLAVYIFSAGANETIDQGSLGGGDDINNWDNAQGWSGQY